MPGPSFIVNTARGVRSVAAHRILAPGRHHLVGTYDGQQLKLYIDGKVAAQRQTAGSLQPSSVPLTLGALAGTSVHFDGRTERARVATVAHSAE